MDKKTCDIVKDLLPSYIDGICLDGSRELVKEHLSSCPECMQAYKDMTDGESPSTTPDASSARPNPSQKNPIKIDEAEVMKKINRKIKKKARINVVIGVVVGAIVLALAFLLMPPNRKLGKDEYQVRYSNYNMIELAGDAYANPDQDLTFDEMTAYQGSVAVYESGKDAEDCHFVKLSLPGYDSVVLVDREYLEANPMVSVISVTSPYYISEYKEKVVEEGSQNVLVMESVKTPLFGGKKDSNGKQAKQYLGQKYYQVTTIEFCEIDQAK